MARGASARIRQGRPEKEASSIAAITILCVCTRARLVCTQRLGTVALRPPFDCERLSEQTLL